MLIEEQRVEQPRSRLSRRRVTWELDEVSAARQIAAWMALAITITIAVALLLGI